MNRATLARALQFILQHPIQQLVPLHPPLGAEGISHHHQFEMRVGSRASMHVALVDEFQMLRLQRPVHFVSDAISDIQEMFLLLPCTTIAARTVPELNMTIGWYPGHMHKARKDITQALQQVDAIIELVDARLPYASENPILNKIIGDKPRLRLMNKADLADPLISARWLDWHAARGIDCQLLDKDDAQARQRILACLTPRMIPVATRPNRIMVVGIPNVGKSTLINLLAQRKIARVGNEPAVTKARQEIRLSDRLALFDTPGILWPRLDDQAAAYRLAISGAIRNTAIELGDVGMAAVALLQQRYPQRLQERYGVAGDGEALHVLERIGRSRGCLVRGGVDLTKAGEVVLNDLRSGKLGLLSLETPDDVPETAALPETGASHDAVPL